MVKVCSAFFKLASHTLNAIASSWTQLDDLELLTLNLGLRPTRLAELITDAIAAIGAVDASGLGMGGVWFMVHHCPLVWCQPFPPDIILHLVSDSNPTGNLTNSDFETTGVVAHQDILAQEHDIREASISILNDYTPAVSRATKRLVTSHDAAAYLLWISSLHQCHFHYNIDFQHISGLANAMADDGSCLFKLSDAAFLAHFEQHYPQPLPWKLCHLWPEMNSALISVLRKKRVGPPSFLNEPQDVTTAAISGSTFAWSMPLIHSSTPLRTQFNTSWSLPHAIAMANLPKMVSPSDLGQWRMPYVPSVR